MSLLPQRKKSAEEIAKLRESLGIPGSPAATDEMPTLEPSAANEVIDTIIPDSHEAMLVHPPEAIPLAPIPAPVHQPGPKPVHSLKRSERMPVLPIDEALEVSEESPAVQSALPTPIPASPRRPKPVRSLKKSEQTQLPAVPLVVDPTPSSKIPFHRHSDDEINEIRRREALALLNAQVPNPRLAAAHFSLLIPGYLLAVAGASCFYFYGFPLAATSGCAGTALAIAAFIFLRRPISRHHAAFIAVIALFVIVFGALHYFPQLRHAT